MPVSIASVLKTVPFDTPDDDLKSDDGRPMETPWHRFAMNLLLDVTDCYLQDRDDYVANGNMFIYFEEARIKKVRFRGPDYFLVWGVKRTPMRKVWAVWNEGGQFPDLIIELASRSTIKIDKTIKKAIYEKKFRTHEYFIYDPAKKELIGWRLDNGRYKRINPNDRGWLWCEELGLWLGTIHSQYLSQQALYLRFFDRDGRLMPTFYEAAAQKAEAERQKAEAEKQKAEVEKQRVETEKQRADAEKLRADLAEAELARLRKQLGGNGRRKK